jgi:hypothetical protein
VELLSALVLAAALLATPAGGAPLAPASGMEAAGSAAEAAPRIVAVEPVRAGDLLACRVRTANLPGAKLASSMRSGLPSAIEMVLEVLDPKDRVVDGQRITFRLAFDLWEETFRVEGAGEPRDFTSQHELEAFLAELPRLPVASFERLRDAAKNREPLRVRAGVVLHPLAPQESERLGDWVAGEASDDEREPSQSRSDPTRFAEPVANDDGREVLVSLGQVIRYFFEGGRERSEVAAQGVSAPFTIAALREEGVP